MDPSIVVARFPPAEAAKIDRWRNGCCVVDSSDLYSLRKEVLQIRIGKGWNHEEKCSLWIAEGGTSQAGSTRLGGGARERTILRVGKLVIKKRRYSKHVFLGNIRSVFWLALSGLLLFCWPATAFAVELNIELSEKTYKKTDQTNTDGSPRYKTDWVVTAYTFDTQTMNLRKSNSGIGKSVSTISGYNIKGDDHHAYQLFVGDRAVAPANDILYQCHVQQDDLVIVRKEYNSYRGPIKALSALSGHPVQVSEIIIYLIRDGRIRR